MIILIAATALSGSLVILVFSILIYYSLEARRQGFSVMRENLEYFSQITYLDSNNVTIDPSIEDTRALELPLVGLVSREGSLIANGPVIHHQNTITRSVVNTSGNIQLGNRVRADVFIHQKNPKYSIGLDYSEVRFRSELGDLGAWVISGEGETWMVCVHGHRSNRRESLRFSPLFESMGLNQMLIKYRNDVDSPVDRGGYHMFGLTEWRDLEAAVAYVINQGAKNIFILGHSMGGSIALQFILKSNLRSHINGIVLESPALDLNGIITAKAKALPFPITTLLPPIKKMVSKLVNLDWSELDYISKASEIETPILLIHSTKDQTVPVAQSDQFANIIPHLYEYLRLEGAPHAASWNFAQHKVESLMKTFISDIVSKTCSRK
ncbi:MAG: hypothetical protein CL698_04810 [Chloroflexi bacterium]|nr:hypothetical protein [Chloroflexota bacterium]|tara:strand:- start:987 stop:2129 length:1143 start_codon:yes stop_codon:yes gene_type:complete